MNRKITLQLVGLLLVLIFTWSSIIAQDSLALTTANLNARSGPATTFDVLEKFPQGTTVALQGRNDVGDWLFVRSVDTSTTAWVAGAYLSLPDGFDIFSLPVTTAQANTVEEETASPPSNPVTTAGSGGGKTISTLNVRSGPGTEFDAITNVAVNTQVIIESRSQVGSWIIIRTPDNQLRGWVATRYVNFDDDISLETLPVSSEIVGLVQIENTSGEPVVDFSNIELPEGNTGELMGRLASVPVFYNFDTPQVRSIFRTGQQLGNRANVFMKAGDSITASQPFMIEYGQGNNYELGEYAYLQDTINYFSSVSPREGIANSFTNRSFAALVGGTANSVMDGLWADPTFCTGETPLSCEIKLTRPSVGLVLFGVQDMRIVHPLEFRIHMGELVESMMSSGVIPVLSTYHTHSSYYLDDAVIYNNVIVDVAEEYNVPLINLWRATQPLPNNGTNLSDPVHLSQGSDRFFDFTGDETIYGVNLRNLLSLQALDQLRKTILQG